MTDCMFIEFLEDDSDLDSLNCVVEERYVDSYLTDLITRSVFTCGHFLFGCFLPGAIPTLKETAVDWH